MGTFNKQLLASNGVVMTRKQIVESYMIFGGIPYYLNYLRPELSLVQNVDMLFFRENSPLRYEFDQLFSSLFRNFESHVNIVRTLAKKKRGMTRADLLLYYVNTPTYHSWSGLAFERVCMMHTVQIKEALGIRGIISHEFSWRSRASKPGAQIDLLIDRKDGVINVCEIKFTADAYVIVNELTGDDLFL